MSKKRKEVGITRAKTYSFFLSPLTVEGLDKIVVAKKFPSRSALIEIILRNHIMEVIKHEKKI